MRGKRVERRQVRSDDAEDIISLTLKKFEALAEEELVQLANQIGVSIDNVQSERHLRAKLLNDAKFLP